MKISLPELDFGPDREQICRSRAAIDAAIELYRGAIETLGGFHKANGGVDGAAPNGHDPGREGDAMTETQQSICTWADATFGPASDVSIAARALEEMAELVTACVNGEPAERIGEEIADVVIVLARLGRSLGLDVYYQIALANEADDRQSPLWHAVPVVNDLADVLAFLEVDRPLMAENSLRETVRDLRDLAARLSIDPHAAIDRKMAVNRTRQWVTDGKGNGRHVKEGQ